MVSSLVQPPLQLVTVASSVETLVAVKVALLPYTTDVILLLAALLEVSLTLLVITEEIEAEEAKEAAETGEEPGEEAAEVGLTNDAGTVDEEKEVDVGVALVTSDDKNSTEEV